MCGIAGIHLRKENSRIELDPILDTMLDKIQHRGGDATGFIALNAEGVCEWQRAAVDVDDFIHWRRPVPQGTRTILAHTRWATQGLAGFIENNHPIRRGPFYVIHNGHITNDDELFLMAGRKRFAQVDSEAIPAYIAHMGELAKVPDAMKEMDGAAAIAVVDERKPLDLVLARGYNSPLYVLATDKLIMWASTEDTIRTAHKKHIGKLPKRHKIENIGEGQAMLLIDGEMSWVTFAHYEPPKYVYVQKDYSGNAHSGSTPLAAVTQHLPTVGGWPKWDDADDSNWSCDGCGKQMPYKDTMDVWAHGSWWTVCEECDEQDVIQRELGEEDESFDDFAGANRSILSDEDN